MAQLLPTFQAKCNARTVGMSAPFLIRPDTNQVCEHAEMCRHAASSARVQMAPALRPPHCAPTRRGAESVSATARCAAEHQQRGHSVSHGVVVSTQDSESCDRGSNPRGRTFAPKATPAWIRTRVARFKVWSANHYTTGAPLYIAHQQESTCTKE